MRRLALLALPVLLLGCRSGREGSANTATEQRAAPEGEPALSAPALVTIDEEQEARIRLDATALRRIDVGPLPPGARFDEARREIVFRPDFTQSGRYTIDVTGYAGGPPATFVAKASIAVEVKDTLRPRAPEIMQTTEVPGFKRLVVRQITDTFLDAPGRAGRAFDAVVIVPAAATTARRAPVNVVLHGFNGGPNPGAASIDTFVIEPHDPDNTYWWGYGEGLPGAIGADAPNYTQRRVLHLLAWLLATFPEADPDRAFVSGGSMGGAGALTLGLLHARHFAGIEAGIAPTVPRNHRPSRVAQLSTWWGPPDGPTGAVWDRMDLTRALLEDAEARDQFAFTKHGKDDPIIHFGAVLTPSPLTRRSFYTTLEEQRIGHVSVWDEGAHGPPDPVLGDGWWDAGWSRIHDPRAYLARNLPFPAFTRSSANEDPGDGSGNGRLPFDPERGFAADVTVQGDTGWTGAIAGAFNRFLRWDSSAIVDTPDRLVLPLALADGPGDPAPRTGYPTKGDRRANDAAVRVDVTPRRTRTFRPSPGEVIRFRFGTRTGTVAAAADGSVTIDSIAVTPSWTPLELERDPP